MTCPIRLRQDLKIVADAANFFFPGMRYVALTEARLKDKHGKSAGNIDVVIAALDDTDEIVDFGAVEVQAVYISGNVSKIFKEYMKSPESNYDMEWPSKNYPSPDYLSSSRKRLAPQLIYKGGILHKWGKRLAVVVHQGFFDQLPRMKKVRKSDAEIAWMIFGLEHDSTNNRYVLMRKDVRYTEFESALATLTTSTAGDMKEFLAYLRERIKKGKIMGVPLSSQVSPEIEPLPDMFE